jgi:hypothetical protein
MLEVPNRTARKHRTTNPRVATTKNVVPDVMGSSSSRSLNDGGRDEVPV